MFSGAGAPLVGTALSCTACAAAFNNSDEQRHHYQSEWHRHNLKRRVANLACISLQEFQFRVQTLEAHTKAQAAEEEDKPNFSCGVCRKQFGGDKQLQQHLRSKKHKEREAAAAKACRPTVGSAAAEPTATATASTSGAEGDDDEMEEPEDVMSPEAVAARIEEVKKRPNTQCLFCNKKCLSLDANLSHMAKRHGFFVPDVECVADMGGMVDYLKEKVCAGFVCLWCNGKGRSFRSLESVQGHMCDKSHCKMAYDTPEDWDEFADFYNYSDRVQEVSPLTRVADDESDEAMVEGEDDDDDGSEGWESMDAEEVEGLGEDERAKLNESAKKAAIEDVDEEDKLKPEFGLAGHDTAYELVLANGRKLRHRDLKVYYKQKIKPQDDRAAIVCSLVNTYARMELATKHHWKTSIELKREKAARQSQLKGQRAQQRWDMRMGMRNNDIARTHYKDVSLLI